MNNRKNENVIISTLLCVVCIITSGFILLPNIIEQEEVDNPIAIWNNQIISINGIEDTVISGTSAILNIDIQPGIKQYNLTIENKGTLYSYIDSYNINSSIDEDIIYNINTIINDQIAPNDTKTYKLTIDNQTDKIFKDTEISLSINLINQTSKPNLITSLNNIIYDDKVMQKVDNTYTFIDDNPNNYIVYENNCYRMINIKDNKIKALYTSTYDKICTNKKIKIKSSYNNLQTLFNNILTSEAKFKVDNNLDIKHLTLLDINEYKEAYISGIELTSTIKNNKVLATDNNYYDLDEELTITPAIIIENVKYLSGEGTKNRPFIIEEQK